MLHKIKLPAIESVLARHPGAVDTFTVCDMAGFVAACEAATPRKPDAVRDWYGNTSFAQSLYCVRCGDLKGVAVSEKYLADMESHVFVARKFRTIDSVVGSVPNVPAYIAGIPDNMRLRRRVRNETAPLSVMVDLTSSGGIDAQAVHKRGAAILALVRLLSNTRAIELIAYIGVGTDGTNNGNYVTVRLDTTPLDLARAAHMLTHVSVARALGYKVARHAVGDPSSSLPWPYCDDRMARKHASEILARVVNPGSDVLIIPGIHLHDLNVTNPVQWIKDMLASHGGETVQGD